MEGPAGIGKSSLLEQAVEAAEANGLAPLRARGGELERDLGWRVVRSSTRPISDELPDADRDRALSGAAGLARAVLGEARDPAGPGDVAGSALHGLYWLTSNLAERRPLVIAVDDAQWADSASLRFLLYLAQRASDLPLALIIAARPEEPSAELVALRSLALRGRRIALLPLSQDGSRRLTARSLGDSPSASSSKPPMSSRAGTRS